MNHVQLHSADILFLIIYLLFITGIGLYFIRNQRTSEEYLLGGRRMPWLAVGISYMMAQMSTYSLVMVPGEIFNHGVSYFVPGLLFPLLALGAFYIFIRFYFRLNSFTPFEYLERRYSVSVRVLVVVMYLWTRLIYLSMVLFSTSKVFEGGAGWKPWFTILLIGVIAIVYTVMGGMKAVIWADVAQFVVLVVGFSIAVYYCIRMVDGGFAGAITYAFEHGHGMSEFGKSEFYSWNPYVRLSFWFISIGLLVEALMYSCADQISIQRLLSTSSYENAKKAMIVNTFLSMPFTFVLWFIGFAIFSFYSQYPDPRVTSGDTAFFTFITTQLPSPFPGLLFAAMLAAAMSTLDAGLNSLSAVWVKEFHAKYISQSASESGQVKLSRYATIGVGFFVIFWGIIIATTSENLRQSVLEAAAIFQSFTFIIVPTFLIAVTSRRANSRLIWLNLSVCCGINLMMVVWYVLSNRSHAPLSGPISLLWIIVPLTVTVLIVPFLMLLRRKAFFNLAVCGMMLFSLGCSLAGSFWYVMSHYTQGGALSFQWAGFPGMIVSFVVGYACLPFCKVPPREKYFGLTLRSQNEAVFSDT